MSVEQDIGMLQGKVEGLQSNVETLISTVSTLDKTVTDLNILLQTTLAEGKGSWKVLVFLAGISGTVGGILSWLSTHIKVP